MSTEIRMTFRIEKCRTVTGERGQLKESEEIKIGDLNTIEFMTKVDPYKYIGLLQTNKQTRT